MWLWTENDGRTGRKKNIGYPLDYLMLLDKIRQFQADPSWRRRCHVRFRVAPSCQKRNAMAPKKKNGVSGGSAPSKINVKLVDMVNHGKSRQ